MKERNIAVAIILSIITCGIYGIYWFIMITNEAKSLIEHNEKIICQTQIIQYYI